jgi:hypothetical protein
MIHISEAYMHTDMDELKGIIICQAHLRADQGIFQCLLQHVISCITDT